MSDLTPDRGSPARSVALGVVVFAATLILLFGAFNVVRRAEDGGAGSAVSPGPAAATSSAGAAVGSATASASATATASAGSSGVPGSPGASPGSGSPSPSPTPTKEAVLIGAGDIADCALDADTDTAKLIVDVPGTVFTAGDNAYASGSREDFRDCYGPTWGAFRDRTRPAPGNHEWDTEDLAGYLEFFGAAAAPNGTSWYSYDVGAWHVVVLDSNCSKVDGCGLDSPQGKWLAGDLAASSARCTLAIWHHPRFSSGEHGNDPSVAPFWNALYDAGADLIVNGHEHDYERFAPQDPSGRADGVRGIREFVVGTGGADLRPFGNTAANSELRAAGAHGVIRLDLQQASYRWTFIPTAGAFSDSGTTSCH